MRSTKGETLPRSLSPLVAPYAISVPGIAYPARSRSTANLSQIAILPPHPGSGIAYVSTEHIAAIA
eukprot:980209-Rhodomonas_salina.2